MKRFAIMALTIEIQYFEEPPAELLFLGEEDPQIMTGKHWA